MQCEFPFKCTLVIILLNYLLTINCCRETSHKSQSQGSFLDGILEATTEEMGLQAFPKKTASGGVDVTLVTEIHFSFCN